MPRRRKTDRALTPDKIAHYRALLRARSQALRDSMSEALRRTQAGSPGAEVGDAADESVRLHETDVSANINQGDAVRLREIEAAEERLEQGHYGVCEDCGEPIDPERLELVPEARRCAPCQEAHEEALARPEPGTL